MAVVSVSGTALGLAATSLGMWAPFALGVTLPLWILPVFPWIMGPATKRAAPVLAGLGALTSQAIEGRFIPRWRGTFSAGGRVLPLTVEFPDEYLMLLSVPWDFPVEVIVTWNVVYSDLDELWPSVVSTRTHLGIGARVRSNLRDHRIESIVHAKRTEPVSDLLAGLRSRWEILEGLAEAAGKASRFRPRWARLGSSLKGSGAELVLCGWCPRCRRAITMWSTEAKPFCKQCRKEAMIVGSRLDYSTVNEVRRKMLLVHERYQV